VSEATRVVIPLRAANRYALPEICIVTGARDDVQWRRTRLAWAPGWTLVLYALFFVPVIPALLRLLCIPLAIVLRIVLGRRVDVELPFGPGRYLIWRLGRVLVPIAVIVSLCGGLPAGLVLVGAGYPVAGLVLVLAGVGGALGTWLALGWRRGPAVQRITDDRVVVDLPHELTAAEFRRVLSGAPPRPAPADSVCAVHRDVPAAIVCARCGSFACADCARSDLATALCAGCGERRDSHVARERLTDGAPTEAPIPIRRHTACPRHPEVEATVACTRCRTPLCEECVRERPGTRVPLCIPCLAREI